MTRDEPSSIASSSPARHHQFQVPRTLARHRHGLRFNRTSTPAFQRDSIASFSCCHTVAAPCSLLRSVLVTGRRHLSSFAPQGLTHTMNQLSSITSCSSSTQHIAPDAPSPAPITFWVAPFSPPLTTLRTSAPHSATLVSCSASVYACATDAVI
ncbi:hypothetical protein BDN70DRAFT_435376 [Pholiota conissans]|uniref:Uncharacterized protein n=1 Tax=Pholiota conissans TaxID=109636 RepID=A0A9P5YP44_9AGAR|nr:hypothetical protein BDN70DRAFT_435376 [Pholiota conissans]